MLMQQQVESLRKEVNQSLKDTQDTLSKVVENLRESVMRQLNENTGQVGSRLDKAASVIGEVQKNLGELGKATQEIKELGKAFQSSRTC